MPKLIPPALKVEAVRLRVEERLSIDEIRSRTGLSVGTLSGLLKDHPLSKPEVQQKMSESSMRNNPLRRYNPDQSKWAQVVDRQELSRDRKGRIAESAVLFRLALLGYEVWRSEFDNNRVDWSVSRPGVNRHVRLQVRWARRGKLGRPLFMVNKSNRGPLDSSICDFVVGYDLETDTAFVTPIAECEGHRDCSCRKEYAEAWHLLGI